MPRPSSAPAVAAMLKTIFAQETKAEAEAQWDAVADALREKNDRLGAMMDASRDDVLAYTDFPKEHWAQISSTNPLERVNKEIKRRSDVIGIFPNDRLDQAMTVEWATRAGDAPVKPGRYLPENVVGRSSARARRDGEPGAGQGRGSARGASGRGALTRGW